MGGGLNTGRVAVMQPYVFPYLGYYQLLHAADDLVLFDDAHFIKKGWINRNRILLGGQPHTFTIPLQGISQNRTIADHLIADDPGWRTKLIASLGHAYARAPMFPEVFPALEAMIAGAHGSIADLAAASIGYVAGRLSLPVRVHRSSAVHLPEGLRGQERILALCAHHGARVYINPAKGAFLYDAQRFAQAGIALRFLQMDPDITYPQVGGAPHVPGLSIIDALMNLAPVELLPLLGRYRLLGADELGPEQHASP